MDPEAILKQLGIDLLKDAEDLEPIAKAIEFDVPLGTYEGGKLKGMVLKAYLEKDVDGEEQMYVGGIASSSIKDRHGDTILPTALIDMERGANDNLTMFLNHKAEVPEGIAGSVVKASIESSSNDPENGAPIYDLNFEKVRIDKTNERAVKTWKSMKGGTKLGMSIGARIPEGGAVRNKKTGALLIAHVDLLETSFVGIPANPRSWVDYATKALKADAVTMDLPVVDVDDKDLAAVAAAVDAALAEKAAVVPPVTPPVNPPVNPDVVPAVFPVTNSFTVGEDGIEIVTAAGACPTCGKGKSASGCSDPYHNSKSDTPSQGAPESGPEADGSPDVTAEAVPPLPDPDELAKLATPDLLRMLVDAQAALGDTTTQLIDAHRKRAEAEQRATDAEREAAEIAKTARTVVLDAAQIIKRLERMPVGQKASFRAIKADFEEGLPAGLDGIYTESFLKQLKGDSPT